MSNNKLKFLVCSDNKFMVFTMQEVLSRNFDCVVEIKSLEENKDGEIFRTGDFDIVMLDISLLFDNEIRKIIDERQTLKAIALVDGEVDYGLIKILSDYADGMIDHTYDVSLIVMIINATINGFQCLPRGRGNSEQFASQLSRLTRREQEVLHFVSQGLSNKKIAEFLGVNYKTVCVHRYNIMFKLKLDDLSDFCRVRPFKLYR